MMKLNKAGLYSSIQDLGRASNAAWGVPHSGVMDRNAAILANRILGNKEDAAVLECTMKGPELEFEKSTFIAVTGAEFELLLDGQLISNTIPHSILPGQRLVFGKLKKGLRAYLAIAGGFQTEKILGSRSFYHPITNYSRILEGQKIPYKKRTRIQAKENVTKHSLTSLNANSLEVWKGPEFHLLSKRQQEDIEKLRFSVSNRNNRMAYQLEPSLGKLSHSILTCPVIPGSVQMTPEGFLFVLMRDGQTTGGYPRVLQLTEESLDTLAQLRTGSSFSLEIKS